MSALDDYRQASDSPLHGLRCVLPLPLRKLIVPLCWRRHDARDFIAEDVEPSASTTTVLPY